MRNEPLRAEANASGRMVVEHTRAETEVVRIAWPEVTCPCSREAEGLSGTCAAAERRCLPSDGLGVVRSGRLGHDKQGRTKSVRQIEFDYTKTFWFRMGEPVQPGNSRLPISSTPYGTLAALLL
jgi:hypothetical protein